MKPAILSYMVATPLWLDVTETLASGRRTGIQRVCVELAREILARNQGGLVRLDPKSGLFVVLNEVETGRLLTFNGGLGNQHRLPKLLAWPLGLFKDLVQLMATWFWTTVPRRQQQGPSSVDWSSGIYLSAEIIGSVARAKALARIQRTTRTILVIHDLFPLTHPKLATLRPLAFSRHWSLALKASRLVTVSHFTASEIVSWANRNRLEPPSVVVAHPGHSLSLVEERRPHCLEEGARFFLCVGTLERRKNQAGLLMAHRRYRELGGTAALVLVGGAGPGSAKLVASLKGAGSRGVLWLGQTTDPELVWLYRRAEALVLPSRAEGFGLPLVEALATGTPCVTMEGSSTAEVAQNYGGCLLVGPQVGELAEALSRFETAGFRSSMANSIRTGELPTWSRFFLTVDRACRN